MGLFTAVYSSNEVINTWIEIDKYSNTYFNLVDGDNVVITELPNSNSEANVISTKKPLVSLNNGLKLQVKSEISSPFTPLIIVMIVLLSLLILGITFSLWKLKNTEILLQKKEILLLNQNTDLKFAKEKAEESDRLKSAFLANMSHEIRTPMNGILGFADLLKNPELSGESQQEFIQIIEKAGKRLLNIINDIISISKIESGLLEVNLKESNINDQIEYIYDFFTPEIEAKGLHFTFKNSLPSKEAIIKTDREKVYAILTNLVKNALKYIEKGSIEIGYTLKNNAQNAEVEFYVKDTGSGIPKDRQKAIFKRFIQADIFDKMALQGAGLGLSISKAYVEMLGGRIWVESEEGVGSTFYFTLPYQIQSEGKFMAKNFVSVDKEEKQIRNLKILVVDDDEISETLISIIVAKFGKEILKARTGREAVEICRNNSDIDLILMDIQMPDMNGYEATRKIRQFNKKVIIIAQTAFGLAGDREKSIAAGCNEYSTKPIIKEKLVALIHKTVKID
ncbi:response regulator [Maribacter sp. ACAM166]|nr:response regulator [Maribacter sp. ACAM166]